MSAAVDRAEALYADRFRRAPEHLVRAPGRVNVIGEHTDYNDGFVLPAAIDREVWIALGPSEDGVVDLASDAFAEPARVDLDDFSHKAPGWAAYVQGVAWALAEAGLPLGGWRGALASAVPVGAGLSSSAALELGVARAFQAVGGWTWDPVTMAVQCRRAENAWVGVASGIMDQLASAAGRAGHALLLDCRSLDVDAVPLPLGVALVVLDTSTRRSLSTSAYNDRRRECEQAAETLGVHALRDASPELIAPGGAVLDATLARRARHVATENDRTQAAARAMRAGDAQRLGELMLASHRSLRDDFEVSSPALDAMVDAATASAGCHGARLTGGGFAGCAVALVDAAAAGSFCDEVTHRYAAATGLTATTHVCRPVDGASVGSPSRGG